MKLVVMVSSYFFASKGSQMSHFRIIASERSEQFHHDSTHPNCRSQQRQQHLAFNPHPATVINSEPSFVAGILGGG